MTEIGQNPEGQKQERVSSQIHHGGLCDHQPERSTDRSEVDGGRIGCDCLGPQRRYTMCEKDAEKKEL